MSSEVFHFKLFDVCHAGSAMKVGTDGVILGLLPDSRGKHLLDVGTGSGLVALLLAQRNITAHIVGIDIDPNAAFQAQSNFKSSPWSERFECICEDISHYQSASLFDLIICNPPFYENSPATSSEARNVARITDKLNYEQLIAAVVRLLSPDGRFSVILPVSVVDKFVLRCWENNLFLNEKYLIQTKVTKPAKRAILTFSHLSIPCSEFSFCLMNADGSRSEEYQNLIKDYFVK